MEYQILNILRTTKSFAACNNRNPKEPLYDRDDRPILPPAGSCKESSTVVCSVRFDSLADTVQAAPATIDPDPILIYLESRIRTAPASAFPARNR
jgi:hypothetical protein